ncbi:MAG: FKBP-type peptidyl-prolyl cis-trans isomerase [Prolixibacteraceae bacterium]|nr:FKBP-type peptidyl-prolyl cis-trans isomerase [Prolixibacteraceae bacterium]MBN2773404.1 FKBP-type peptidyl-prolyl cis-trans isomerase [Prolixibacteraceae bacterium]
MKNIKLENALDSTSYAIGLQMGETIKDNLQDIPGGTEMNMDILTSAFAAAAKGGETKFDRAAADQIIRDYFQKQAENEAQSNLEEGNAFLENNGKRDGVATTESGLQYEIIKEGNGPKPAATDKVKVNYQGTLIDGTVFDSSIERGEPVTFPVNGVIRGWVEALQLMPVGSKWKLYIPSELAYGERGSGSTIGPNTTLIFEVELLEIVPE